MGWVNYDPSSVPSLPNGGETIEFATKYNMFPINILCEGKDGIGGGTFLCFVYTVPRIGEKITTEDGCVFQVIDILHNSSSRKQDGKIAFISAIANVVAKFLKQDVEKNDPHPLPNP